MGEVNENGQARCRRHQDQWPAAPPAGSNTMTLVKSTTFGGPHFAQMEVSAADLEIVPSDLLLIPGYEWE